MNKLQAGPRSQFGSRVRRLRLASGLTQAELAEQAGVSERTISDLERGLRGSIYPATARQLASTLGVTGQDVPGFLSEAAGTTSAAEPGVIPSDLRARMPIPLTRLLGRQDEVATALELIGDPAVRLATIVGPGGIGKIRLAIEVGNFAAVNFAGGAHFVSLAATDDPDNVLPLLATAVGVMPADGPLESALARRFERESTLVILDTVEHVVAAAPAIAELLEICPGLKVLATSRTPLQVRGERTLPVQPLAVHDQAGGGPGPAVELFLERATAVQSGHGATGPDVEVVTEICDRLDGLPLAIELAAARIRHMALKDLQNQLRHRLDPLVGGARDLPARQRTMRGMLDWSYALLGADEMRLFRALAAFRGGFDAAAAQAMLRARGGEGTVDIMPALSVLVDSSLVLTAEASGDMTRYRLLEVTREYAAERSMAAGEFDGLRICHAQFFTELASRVGAELRGEHQLEWFARLQNDEGNFRAALAWALESGEAVTALQLAGSLWMFWRWAGLFTEGRAWLESVLAAGGACGVELRAPAQWGAGWLAYHQGDYARTAEIGAEMLLSLDGNNDRFLRRNALTLVGNAALADDRMAEAFAALEQALQLTDGAEASWSLATSLLNLGTARLHAGQADVAHDLFVRALAIYDMVGDRHFAARTLIHVAYARLAMGDGEDAATPTMRAMEMVAEIGDPWGIADGLEAMSSLRSRAAPRVAVVLAGAAERLREKISMQQHPADAPIIRRYLDLAQSQMSAEARRAAMVQGREMALDAAVALALGSGGGLS